MINNNYSVTNSVTEEISTKGYDFYWDKAIDGYEWYGKENLVFDEELNRSLSVLDIPWTIPKKFDKDRLLFSGDLNRNTIMVHEVYPESIDIQEPWLIAKGNLDLSLNQDSRKTLPRNWKVIATQEYSPLSIRHLHRLFASLNTDSIETEALRFANQYGFLGRSVSLVVTPPREHPALPVISDKRGIVHGESLHRWQRESAKIGVLLAVWDLIRQRDWAPGKLGQFFIWRDSDCVEVRLKWRYQKGLYEISKWDGKEKVAGYGHYHEIVENRQIRPEFFNAYDFGIASGPAWYWLGSKINAHLHGIRPKLEGLKFNEREVNFMPLTLLDALWLLFMLEVQGKTKVERCRYCNNWFEFERKTKAYCSGNCRRLAKYHRDILKEKGGTK